MNWQIFSLLLLLLSSAITYFSYQKSKHNQFYTDTHYLIPLGIFVWGDGLILGPFWAISALLFYSFPGVWILRYFLLFFFFREMFEVIFWILHQASGKDYEPPLFRRVDFLDSDQSAILYQLMTMCLMILAAVGLALSFVWIDSLHFRF